MVRAMRRFATTALSAILIPGFLGAQNAAPVVTTTTTKETTVSTVPSPETRAILLDRQQRNRLADIDAALRIKSEADAQQVVDSILAEANAAAIISDSKARARIRAEEAGRTQVAREESIAFLRQRLRGGETVIEVPESFRSRVVVQDPATGAQVVRAARPRFFENDQRVVTYRTLNEVPPVLIASSRMNRVRIEQIAQSPYAAELVAIERRPTAYVSPEAYALTYSVDPNSEVTRDDILFVQGSTAFADAYSYDLVVDLAVAINDPELAAEKFVIEGHASAEGNYDENLALSQARAERIAREMVNQGVSTSRLIPVGYGDNEAVYPAETAESIRATDRRVAVYRLK
jgi:outer membrane protein OmpA-like peptidoglycan-associated protein